MCSLEQSRPSKGRNEGNGRRNSSGDLFAISKKGSGANRVPTACGIGGWRVGLSAVQRRPNFWKSVLVSVNGTQFLEMGPNFARGTHNLANGTRYISRWDLEPSCVPSCGAGSRMAEGAVQVGYLGSTAFTNPVGLRHQFPPIAVEAEHWLAEGIGLNCEFCSCADGAAERPVA